MTSVRREAGFTLVEAMVSLFVFALLATGCVAMLAQSVSAQGRISEAEQAMRGLQAARAMLASDLAQVAPGPPVQYGDERSAFDGVGAGVASERHIRFMRGVGSPDPLAPFATSLARVEYFVDQQGRLVRRAVQANGDASDRLVLAGASDVRFEFNDGLAWVQEWRTPNGAPPRAVAILADTPRYGTVRLSAYVGL
jgi:general secretion pathway protein J